ncbi:MAG: hypothetical protein EOM50_04455, partial [Erysipelotrichia bacterium]|nr:hypothetical protein [Erysipelotrichia bacterium]
MIRKGFKAMLAFFVVITSLASTMTLTLAMDIEYKIYPNPQKVTYDNGEFILQQFNVIFDEGIDDATKARLNEIAALKNLQVSVSDSAVENKTNIYVGIYGSNGKASQYINSKYAQDATLFEKTDAYFLKSDQGSISVLGKDSDASFYGLTTLYHIVKQIDSLTLRNFTISDYADVVSRGFIEGYYGNPWSTQDRMNLMEWSGYYKLNSYFYAPKDDPKHKAKWRELYSPQELAEKIIPLAEVGNASKCRFVYALHPFGNSPIRFDGNYEADMAILKAKFSQVIDSGVRQIAVLADDAPNWGAANYQRFLEDMTQWIKEKQNEYPDLKSTLPFCVEEYGGWGETYYQNFPENVQIIMTGGKIWGEVSNNFTNSFYNNTGRGPYMWINWPCSDNSKNHLIMGGYSTFLQPGVNPENIQGIVLNPMQQSEPSKVAIFGNADYAWNIWDTQEQADQAWEDSFSYVNHNSALESDASMALKELSKHMMNQAMDGRVTSLKESVELEKLLTPFKASLASEGYTNEAITAIENEFTILAQAAQTYRTHGNPLLLGNLNDYAGRDANEQMAPWLDSWDDTTSAALSYLQALKDYKSGDVSNLLIHYSKAQQAFADVKNNKFWYVDHYESAEVGVQHIVPFIKALDSYLAKKVAEQSDPNLITQTYISDVFINPSSGKIENVFDHDDNTFVQFTKPAVVKEGNYVGVLYNRGIDVHKIRFSFAGGHDHIFHSKLEYTTDKKTWKAVNDTIYDRPDGSSEAIEVNDLNLTDVKGIRLVATSDNLDRNGNLYALWLKINSIDINKEEVVSDIENYTIANMELEKLKEAGYSLSNAYDKNENSQVQFYYGEGANKDSIQKGSAVIADLGGEKAIGSIRLLQGDASAKNDLPDLASIEYSSDKQNWKSFGTYKKEMDQSIQNNVNARYIRIRVDATKNVWWRFRELFVYAQDDSIFTMSASAVNTAIGKHGDINDQKKNNKYAYIVDGDSSTLAWLTDSDRASGIASNAGVQIDFNREVNMSFIKIKQGSGDKLSTLKVQYQNKDQQWKDLTTINDAQADIKVRANNTKATAIRIINGGGNTGRWWQLYEVSITEASEGKNKVYSNIENHGYFITEEDDTMELAGNEIVFPTNAYLGIDLGSIQGVSSISVDQTNGQALTLQTSLNGLVWQDVADANFSGNARYVRYVNNTDSEMTATISSLKVKVEQVTKFGTLLSSDINVIGGWGDTRNNAKGFDNDMTTVTKFGGSPKKANSAIYDFGKALDVHSLRIYTQDSQMDYIRDAKIYLSEDKNQWHEAFTIGDGVVDSDRETPFGSIIDANKKSDSNYPNIFYYGNNELSIKARYMKIEITANYPDRALAINEIMINQGAYISTETDKAFESSVIEERNHVPSNIVDKDLTTTYKPAEKNGSFTYHVSDGSGIKAFRVIQSGKASSAKIKAIVYNEKTRAAKEQELDGGYLTQSINEFYIPEGNTLLAIKIEWTEDIPEIAEFINTSRAEDMGNRATAKNELQSTINSQPANFDTWTEHDKMNYNAVKELATKTLNSSLASAYSLTSMNTTLANMKNSGIVVASEDTIKAIQKLIDERLSNDLQFYTKGSYEKYDNAIKEAQHALANSANLSQKQAEALLAKMNELSNRLEYSTHQRELAELRVSAFNSYIKEDYTEVSYQKLADVYTTIQADITKDKKGVQLSTTT